MLGRGSRPSSRLGEASQPLLNSSHEDLTDSAPNDIQNHSDILFSAHDEDTFEHSALDAPEQKQARAERSVRFQEDVEVRVVPPPLRSTYQSREAGVCYSVGCSSRLNSSLEGSSAEYELDTDDLDDTALAGIDAEQQVGRRRDQSMPLLIGLADSSSVRRSLEDSIPLSHDYSNGEVNLEELAAKQHSGGGLLNSIANMSNSILGAGELCGTSTLLGLRGLIAGPFRRNHWYLHPHSALYISC